MQYIPLTRANLTVDNVNFDVRRFDEFARVTRVLSAVFGGGSLNNQRRNGRGRFRGENRNASAARSVINRLRKKGKTLKGFSKELLFPAFQARNSAESKFVCFAFDKRGIALFKNE